MSGTVYIMRGLPGSGKSTKADKIQEQHELEFDEVSRLSFDDYFMIDGEYQFSKELYHGTGGARFQCMKDYIEAVSRGQEYIIIDNTNPTWNHCEIYVKIALDNGYDILFCESNTPWAWDAEECANRNVHKVPIEEVQRRLDIYESSENLTENCMEYCKERGIINVEKVNVDDCLLGVVRKVYPCGVR